MNKDLIRTCIMHILPFPVMGVQHSITKVTDGDVPLMVVNCGKTMARLPNQGCEDSAQTSSSQPKASRSGFAYSSGRS